MRPARRLFLERSKFPTIMSPIPALRPSRRRGRDQQTALRGVIGIRGDPERNKICRTAILSAVMGGRPIDPTQAARRMYASRQFEAPGADFRESGERGAGRGCNIL
jgi:hypothetical protein